MKNAKVCAYLVDSAEWAASMPRGVDAVFDGDSADGPHTGILTEMG